MIKFPLSFIILVMLVGCSTKSVHFKNESGNTGIFEADMNGKEYALIYGDTTISYKLKSVPSIPKEYFESLEISEKCFPKDICIDFQLNEAGTRLYKEFTIRNYGSEIFYVIDDVIIAAPVVGGTIYNGRGQFPIKDSMFDSLFVWQ